jgi:hypothetical protein
VIGTRARVAVPDDLREWAREADAELEVEGRLLE